MWLQESHGDMCKPELLALMLDIQSDPSFPAFDGTSKPYLQRMPSENALRECPAQCCSVILMAILHILQ